MPYPNINAERSRAGMTVEDLARHLGVTRKTVYNWMAHGSIPQSKLVKMSELFNCSIDYLLEREPDHESSRFSKNKIRQSGSSH